MSRGHRLLIYVSLAGSCFLAAPAAAWNRPDLAASLQIFRTGLSLAIPQVPIPAGQPVDATAVASDPDGDPLTYSWRVDGQPYPGTTSRLRIDTTGMIGGVHSVTVTVDDGRGGTASDTETFTVISETITLQVDRRLDNLAKARLDELAIRLQQDPRLRATLTGHTDSRGEEAANRDLGLKRAEMVRDYLVAQHGLAAERLQIRSAGESEPVADNQTEEGRLRNRRVEIVLSAGVN